MSARSNTIPTISECGKTAHVVFVHGLFGSNLVLRDNPSDVCWGDNPVHFLRTLVRRRHLLTQMASPRPLVPLGLTRNYSNFVKMLGFLGFHAAAERKLSQYVYDWRIGIAEASLEFNTHLAGVPERTAIVAHSLGGLVVLYALASGGISPENLNKISRVILIATPYSGSTFALLGLAGSGDFMRRASEFLPNLLQTLFTIVKFAPDLLTDLLAPTFGSFQSLYDMVPHDVDHEDLRILKLAHLSTPVTSGNWPFWTVTKDSERMRQESLRVQTIIRAGDWPVDIVSIRSDADPTPHWCVVGGEPAWKLWQLREGGNVDGDGIVAACCTFPASDCSTRKLIWSDRLVGLTTHSSMLDHPRTHEFLKELLA